MTSARSVVVALLAAVLLAAVVACATGPEGPEGGGPPPGPGRGGRGMGPDQPRHEDSWKTYDLNGDGRISRSEFAAVRNACFIRYDASDDGVLVRSEARRVVPARQAERLEAAFVRTDRDGDGQITREEHDRAGDAMFRFVDANGDGVIAGMELVNLSSALAADLCQPSGPPDGGDGKGPGGPSGGPGPRNRW